MSKGKDRLEGELLQTNAKLRKLNYAPTHDERIKKIMLDKPDAILTGNRKTRLRIKAIKRKMK